MTIQHKFVDLIPTVKEFGIVYISMEFAVASHLCPCKCGNLIVTPFAQHGWSLIFDGETITLNHSIGNWDLPCKSHYWIKKGKIQWAGVFDEKKISRVREKDVRDHKQSISKRHKKV